VIILSGAGPSAQRIAYCISGRRASRPVAHLDREAGGSWPFLIGRHFARIVDIRALQFVGKPDPQAYTAALALAGARGAECLFVDDAARNLLPARASGMLTVLVNGKEQHRRPPPGADYVVGDVLGLERIVASVRGQTG